MRPAYLSTGNLALRAMVATDASAAMSWFPAPFPVSAGQAGRWLADAHRSSVWDDPGTLWLAVLRTQPGTAPLGDEGLDQVLGVVQLRHPRARTSDLSVHLARYLLPDERDALQAEVIRLVVPWVRDELEAMVVTLSVGSDDPSTIAAAEGLGMVLAARLREHLARPGGRADLLWYQALNPAGRTAVTLQSPTKSTDELGVSQDA